MKLVIFIALLLIGTSAFAVEIASCYNPSGKTYYPEYGLVAKKDSGWVDDKITGGIVKLSKISEDKYDIVFVDTTKKITSSIEDGGTVLMLTRGQNSVTFMVIYPGQTAEIYTFLTNTSGKSEYILMISRSGSSAIITKATLMRGECDNINFSEL